MLGHIHLSHSRDTRRYTQWVCTEDSWTIAKPQASWARNWASTWSLWGCSGGFVPLLEERKKERMEEKKEGRKEERKKEFT